MRAGDRPRWRAAAAWLRDRALDPALDEDEDYVARVKALTPADVQAAAKTFAESANRVRLVLTNEPVALLR